LFQHYGAQDKRYSLGVMLMSSSHTKKQFEGFLLEQFLAAAQIEAEVVDVSKEAPDVILRVGEELKLKLDELPVNTLSR